MKCLIVLCLVGAVFGYPAVPLVGVGLAPAAAPVPTLTYVPSAQFHSQNEFGGYNYGYVSADGQGKNELRGADGSVVGTYQYVDPQGKPVTVQYSAGPQGFSASGLHLPQPVPLPEANLRATAEHLAAKAAVKPTPAPAPAPVAPVVAQPAAIFAFPGFAG